MSCAKIGLEENFSDSRNELDSLFNKLQEIYVCASLEFCFELPQISDSYFMEAFTRLEKVSHTRALLLRPWSFT